MVNTCTYSTVCHKKHCTCRNVLPLTGIFSGIGSAIVACYYKMLCSFIYCLRDGKEHNVYSAMHCR